LGADVFGIIPLPLIFSASINPKNVGVSKSLDLYSLIPKLIFKGITGKLLVNYRYGI
jgi:hypothetical protein